MLQQSVRHAADMHAINLKHDCAQQASGLQSAPVRFAAAYIACCCGISLLAQSLPQH